MSEELPRYVPPPRRSFSVGNIQHRWLRRLVLVVLFVPTVLIAAVGGMIDGVWSILVLMNRVWKL